MIRGMHALFYTPEADAARAFLRDVLEIRCVDSGGGWLIFGLDKAELGVHPGEAPSHQLSFFCDDIEATAASLKQKGVELKKGIWQEPWGRALLVELPGGVDVLIYQPTHAQP